MIKEYTLSIIKPDAVQKACIGAIYQRLEAAGLRIVAAKMLRLSREQAQAFYQVHAGKPFYQDLVSFMISGPVMVQVLAGEQAITKYRALMGHTDPQQAAPGTIRADFAENIDKNAVHGSDSPETAKTEITFFFKPEEMVGV